MKYNPELHHRHSIRLTGYDYSSQGAYFVTICVHDRSWLFGYVDEDVMRLSEFGTVIDTYLQRFSKRSQEVLCPSWVIMPNHIHCIIMITGNLVIPQGSKSGSLGSIVGNFKY